MKIQTDNWSLQVAKQYLRAAKEAEQDGRNGQAG